MRVLVLGTDTLCTGYVFKWLAQYFRRVLVPEDKLTADARTDMILAASAGTIIWDDLTMENLRELKNAGIVIVAVVCDPSSCFDRVESYSRIHEYLSAGLADVIDSSRVFAESSYREQIVNRLGLVYRPLTSFHLHKHVFMEVTCLRRPPLVDRSAEFEDRDIITFASAKCIHWTLTRE